MKSALHIPDVDYAIKECYSNFSIFTASYFLHVCFRTINYKVWRRIPRKKQNCSTKKKNSQKNGKKKLELSCKIVDSNVSHMTSRCIIRMDGPLCRSSQCFAWICTANLVQTNVNCLPSLLKLNPIHKLWIDNIFLIIPIFLL